MSEHTAGPWTGEVRDDGAFEIWRGAMIICSRNPWNHRAAESKANARLIAAAPELLEAALKTIEENGHLADGDNCTLRYLKQAIAKAKVTSC